MMVRRMMNLSENFRLFSAQVQCGFGSEKPMSHYYKILGLKPGYSQDQLKNAYLEMVKKYHPDLSTQPNAQEKFQEIQEAYDILQDPSKRPQTSAKQHYDSEPTENEENRKQKARQFKEKFYDTYSRKKEEDDGMNFTYNLYKGHYEKYQTEKRDKYDKYTGSSREYYARKDQPVQQPLKKYGPSVAFLAITLGAFWMVNVK